MAEGNAPGDLKYSRTDEWVRLDGDVATVGITDFAQGELNDIVFVDLPEVGAEVGQGTALGAVDSVKATSELNAPVSGTVIEVNTALRDKPELLNEDPYGNGWIAKIRVSGGVSGDLMDSAAYSAYRQL